jgi:lipopolysaccharide transport system permease protein
MLGLYVLVFGFIFGGNLNQDANAETRIEYALGIFIGLAIHHFLAEILTISPTIIATNQNLVKKVVFPTSILPTTVVATALVHFGISLVLIYIGILASGIPVNYPLLFWLPLVFVPLVLFVLGLSLGLSALGVFWRDILQITPFLSMALLFASAVFYPVSQIPPPAWTILKFNPLIHWIEEIRKIVFWGHSPNIKHLGYLWVVGTIALLLGCFSFHKLRRYFADTL